MWEVLIFKKISEEEDHHRRRSSQVPPPLGVVASGDRNRKPHLSSDCLGKRVGPQLNSHLHISGAKGLEDLNWGVGGGERERRRRLQFLHFIIRVQNHFQKHALFGKRRQQPCFITAPPPPPEDSKHHLATCPSVD